MQFFAAGTFLSHGLRSYLFSWAAMLPVVVAAPFIRRLADRITR
ncbi:DUF2798 domain-containing protein [Paraburkholderia fungorum]|nr:DUF2798 domain-containing protein [Paraburkholderia fungorum]